MELESTAAMEGSRQGDRVGLIQEDQPKKATKMESTDSDSTRAETSPLHRNKAAQNKQNALQSYSLRVIIISCIVFAIAVTVALILTIYLGPPQLGAHGAVASDVGLCSEVGLDILKKGGNAVDSAVATLFCLGVVQPHSSGLGGGGFMIVHDHKTQQSTAYDFREVSTKAATPDMFKTKEDRLFNGLSVAVPGELRGLWNVHQDYGKLPWSDVVFPAADIARTGFNVTKDLAYILKTRFTMDQFKDKYLSKIFVRNGQFLKEGDFMKREDLAKTLDQISEIGADALYTGYLASTIIDAVVDAGGVMTLEDLAEYRVIKREVIKTQFKGSTIATMPPPSAGPVLLLVLNILQAYNWTSASLDDPMTYHTIIEAFKWSYAHHGLLGDPAFSSDVRNASDLMIDPDYGKEIQAKINNMTYTADHYNPLFLPTEDKGTTHLSVVDTSELMVSATSTVNWWFGSLIMTKSGILLNNEMADFSFQQVTSPFGLPPNENNYLSPGGAKRPLSSMAPTMLYNPATPCSLRMAVGGSNGSKILSGIAETILNVKMFGMQKDLKKAVEQPRFHNQLFPDVTEYEDGFPEAIVDELRNMGHSMKKVSEPINVVQAVLKINDDIWAHSDSRKSGKAAMF